MGSIPPLQPPPQHYYQAPAPKGPNFLLWVLAAVGLLSVTCCGFGVFGLMFGTAAVSKGVEQAASMPATTTGAGLVVLDHKGARGQFGNPVIKGTIQNDSERSYSYVQVEINLYDKSGAQVGSAIGNVNNLEPRAKWNFEAAPLTLQDYDSYKIKAVTGW